jgi:hypothetical protein
LKLEPLERRSALGRNHELLVGEAAARDEGPTSDESETSVTAKGHPAPSFGSEDWHSHSLEGSPEDLSVMHNLLRHMS